MTLKHTIAATIAIVSASTGLIAVTNQANATSFVRTAHQVDCRFQPHFPARFALSVAEGQMLGHLTVTGGRDCEHSSRVGVTLARANNHIDFAWASGSPPNNPHWDTAIVFVQDLIPGRHAAPVTTDCSVSAPDGSNLSCLVGAASSLVKFAGRARLSANRNGRTITFHARALRFGVGGFTRETDVVTIQRLDSGTWRTIHRATARKGSYTWSYRHRAPASYRALAAPTAKAFRGTSRTIKR